MHCSLLVEKAGVVFADRGLLGSLEKPAAQLSFLCMGEPAQQIMRKLLVLRIIE